MTGSGSAKLAIWNGIKRGQERKFELWHSHLHLMQKREMGILTSGARYVADADSGPAYFTLYESTAAETFGPAGYATPSPTPDLDRSVREDFIDFVRGVFVTEVAAGAGRAGWIATVSLASESTTTDRAAWSAAFAQLVGGKGIVAAELTTYDHATTTSFVLRLEPRPTLPATPALLLLRGIDRRALAEAIEAFPTLLAEHALAYRVASAQIFMLQHEFQA
ncbi:MAG: hypothetical protein ABI624_04555 [Casimicrobiaceae bacterium]